MPPKSSIKSLDPKIKAELDRLLSQDNMTIDELVGFLQSLGAEVSRSAVGRYSQNYKTVASKMKEYKEMATAFANELGTEVESDAHQVIVQMLHTMLMRVGMQELDRDEPLYDPKDLMFLGSTIKNLMGSIKDRQAMEEKALQKARQQVADEASVTMKQAGLSPDQVKFWREDFLGVKSTQAPGE
ncbi:DUF3486 family protein [Emcibacter sp.]|uniref:DUF3486 family protein n=1 Tax=Emcibacter sp. TaxID=1979954 RepID=UPI002AA78064|nr:DUF3486 family protein [Emcibacter sp.]